MQSNKPAIIKTQTLYLDMIMIQGKTENKLIKDAPIPKATKSAGNAQQIRVLTLVNKLNVAGRNCFNILLLTKNTYYIITRICDYFLY